MKTYHLTTPISDDDIKDIRIGDIVYLNGSLTTCRDVAHRRLVEEHRPLPVDVRNKAILHAGPIIKANNDGTYEMVAVGPTTSMRMEKFEEEFVRQTGVKLIVGKGGMGPGTQRACKKYKALHLVYPAGNAVYAALKVQKIVDAQWKDLGMPETLWSCEVKDYGPLIVSIDTNGDNLFEKNKVIFNERKEKEIKRIQKQVSFIK
ncbi:L(+)-tartrate dehydratase subunit beta [Limosilactobacillus fermentum]|uniref:L(+)-tartrate dehydratase subunit beta n=1 Tax=Limosilactobacillus fermentum TaxID=1613 RepID=UPI003166EFC1